MEKTIEKLLTVPSFMKSYDKGSSKIILQTYAKKIYDFNPSTSWKSFRVHSFNLTTMQKSGDFKGEKSEFSSEGFLDSVLITDFKMKLSITFYMVILLFLHCHGHAN